MCAIKAVPGCTRSAPILWPLRAGTMTAITERPNRICSIAATTTTGGGQFDV